MQTLRTPDACFAGLPDFDYEPHYALVPDQDGGSLRMAWVEAGPADGPAVLLLHGEPSWSFLYRTMLAPLAAAGLRAIAPDLVGFGRSDKPAAITDHSYARHVEWTRALVADVLDLHAVTLVGQDWGGLIGLRLAAEHPERFARIIAANTGLPAGDHPMPEVWHRFKDTVLKAKSLDVGRLVRSGCRRPLSEQAQAGYDAPFPDESFKAGPRAMPGLVPIRPDDPASAANRAAWTALTESTMPVLVAFSDGDPITATMGPILQRALPGAHGRQHPTIADAGHFLQEDAGPDLAAHVIAFIAATPT
jgi:haloalkane dehalogenase